MKIKKAPIKKALKKNKNIGPIILLLLGDIIWDPSNTNAGGNYDECWYGQTEDTLTWPAPTASPAALGDKIKALGTIAMKSTKRMYRCYTTQDTSELSDDLVGETDGKSFENFFEFFTPGDEDTTMELVANWANGNYFFIIRLRSGKFKLFGGQYAPAKLESGSVKYGKDAKGRKGVTVKFKKWGLTPTYTYVAQTVPLTPAP